MKHCHSIDVYGTASPSFAHKKGGKCVKCKDCETWFRDGGGLAVDAECHRSHGEFVTHDSGERIDYPSGMRRDTTKGKLRFDLIPLFMLKRVAGLYTRGAEKYGDNNWQLANSEEELTRFKASAFRHFVQWLDGVRDEDHGAAVFFNIAAAEMVSDKLTAK